ncbi:hypothetical protein ABT119_40030 [Streptomyces sp. NPDC001910]|uniref:hypothetical protein n=1 Tax=Streptomyces sp. NPDC001910 TaxID=3154403 RepID=UPI0033292766
MLSHRIESGVLVLSIQDDLGAESQDALAALISDLIHVHESVPVVIVLGAAATASVIDAVVRAHRMCRSLSVVVSVATPCASARRRLRAAGTAQGGRMVVHARTDIAITTAFSTAA